MGARRRGRAAGPQRADAAGLPEELGAGRGDPGQEPRSANRSRRDVGSREPPNRALRGPHSRRRRRRCAPARGRTGRASSGRSPDRFGRRPVRSPWALRVRAFVIAGEATDGLGRTNVRASHLAPGYLARRDRTNARRAGPHPGRPDSEPPPRSRARAEGSIVRTSASGASGRSIRWTAEATTLITPSRRSSSPRTDDQRGRAHREPVLLVDGRQDDHVGHAGLVLDQQEHDPLGGRRALAGDEHAGDARRSLPSGIRSSVGAADRGRVEAGADQLERVLVQRHALSAP